MLANPKISWQNWEAAGFAGKNKRPRKIDEASFLVSIFASIFGTTTAWLLRVAGTGTEHLNQLKRQDGLKMPELLEQGIRYMREMRTYQWLCI
jgi:hypothetical protein